MQNVMWKMMVKKWPPKLEKSVLGAILASPNFLFFRDFGNKNEDGFLQYKNKQKWQQMTLPNPPQS